MSQSEDSPEAPSRDEREKDEAKTAEDLQPGTMSFRSHLEELRRRVIVSMIAVGICMAGFMFWQDKVMGILLDPYQQSWKYSFSVWHEDVFKAQDFDKLEAD